MIGWAESWQEFFAMGEHAVYVWASFGAVAVVMLVNWLLPVWQHRKLLSDLRRQAVRSNRD